MISVTNVSKYFAKKKKQVVAVENLSIEVRDGEVYGLIGANGAGKTTTLRMIATTLKPSVGEITVDGFDTVKNPYEVRSRIGLLFGGDTGLYDRLTARENITYFGELYGMNKDLIEKRIEIIADAFSMRGFLDRRASTFSRGMKQKTAFARSVIHNPSIMLFDEPNAGLDVIAADEMEKFVFHCKNEGKTIILSSHDMNEVEALCDRVGIINEGKLLATGRIDELKERYCEHDLKKLFVSLIKGEAEVKNEE